MTHIDVDSLDGERLVELEYDEQATVKRLMRHGLATIHKGVVRIANSEMQALDRPQRGNQRSPFGIGG